MKRSSSIAALLLGVSLTLSSLPAWAKTDIAPAKTNQYIGIVNFKTCADGSKIGRQEMNAMEAMQKQLAGNLEKAEKDLVDLDTKMRDPDFRDSLSPEAEAQMTQQLQTLSQQVSVGRNQFYQAMQQAQMKMIQTLGAHIARASQIVAKRESLDFVMTEEACFFYNSARNVTSQVVAEMDKIYEEETKAGVAPVQQEGQKK
jgi:outer membrane protein